MHCKLSKFHEFRLSKLPLIVALVMSLQFIVVQSLSQQVFVQQLWLKIELHIRFLKIQEMKCTTLRIYANFFLTWRSDKGKIILNWQLGLLPYQLHSKTYSNCRCKLHYLHHLLIAWFRGTEMKLSISSFTSLIFLFCIKFFYKVDEMKCLSIN